MKILALEHELPDISADRFTPSLLKEEAARAWQLHQTGVIRELYFREGRREAILMLECPGVDEARAALATLPLVREKLIAFDIIPLVPYPGFARLFQNG